MKMGIKSINNMYYYTRNNFKLRSKGGFSILLIVVLSMILLLVFMKISSLFAEGILNTCLNIVSMIICIHVCLSLSGLKYRFGARYCRIILFICFFIAILSLLYFFAFVNPTYLQGNIDEPSNHIEHQLMYQTMKDAADGIIKGIPLKQAVWYIFDTHYFVIYTYCSFIFLFGGVNILNMCVWNTMHMFIAAFMVTLIGENTQSSMNRKTVFAVALLQPFFLSGWIYNKQIVGVAFLVTGIYLMLYYRNTVIKYVIASVIALILMWIVRLQYVIIAFILFVVFKVINVAGTNRWVKILSIVLIGGTGVLLVFSVYGVSGLLDELNVNLYMKHVNFGLISLLVRPIRAMLPYFPWDAVFRTQVAYYSVYAIIQEPVNIVLWGFAISDFFTCRHKNRLLVFIPPLLFILAGMLNNNIHAGYVSMTSCMLILSIDEERHRKLILPTIIAIFALVFVASSLYSMLGFTGSGVIQNEL